MVWYSHLFKNFPQYVVIHIVKDFGVINKADVDVFSRTLLLFLKQVQLWYLSSGTSVY